MAISNNSLLPWWKQAWQGWLRFGHWVGNIMSWVWMPLFYYIIAMPFALGVKLFGDPFRIRTGLQKSYWTPKRLPKQDLAWARSQGSVPAHFTETSSH